MSHATHRHLKTGHLVRVRAHGKVQASTGPLNDMDDVVIYEHDGHFWVRPVAEFNDGRFEPVKSGMDLLREAIEDAKQMIAEAREKVGMK